MPILRVGWELHIIRIAEQHNPLIAKTRTVGRYQVYHDGVAQTGAGLSGMVAEARGPGKNSPAGNGRCVKAGRYPLATQRGERYLTWGYVESDSKHHYPQPGFELKRTGERTEILVHPGHDFLASIGCINPCTSLPDASEMIDFAPSRRRVLALIADMAAFVGESFPQKNDRAIPDAYVVIDEEF